MQIEALVAEMPLGESLTVWTIRLALALYVLSVSLLLINRTRQQSIGAKILWTAACLIYVIHVICAFQFHHHWSHREAYLHTAERTRDVIGIAWGGGVYFNYFFTLLWICDTLLQWFRPHEYLKIGRFWLLATHAFMAFIAFNATVIFAEGPVRWFGIGATIWFIGLLAARTRRKKESE